MSNSTRPPAMLTYMRDFAADTLEFSAEEVGAYWLLLIKAWVGVAGCPPCHLPSDESQLRQIARLTRCRWLKAWPKLRPLFSEAASGHLFQARQLAEYREQLARSAAGSMAAHVRHHGRKGGDDGVVRPFRRKGA